MDVEGDQEEDLGQVIMGQVIGFTIPDIGIVDVEIGATDPDSSTMNIEGSQEEVGAIIGQEIGVKDPDMGIVDMEIGNLEIDSGVVVGSRTTSPDGMPEICQQDIIGDANEKDPSGQIICFVNEDAKISPSPVLQYVLDVDQAFDTVISCGDGKVGAHRLVLAAASPFIGSLFSGDHRLGEVAVIILPDIRVAIMKTLLSFCYTGSMMFPKELEQEIFDAMRILLMGEHGELTLKKVILCEGPRPMSSTSNIFSEQQQSSRIDRNNSRESRTPPSANREIRVAEMSMSSSDEEDTDTGTDSGNENDENCDPSASINNIKRDEGNVKHVPPVLSTFVSNPGCEEAPYAYIIAPLAAGAKVKKWQCSRCPAAFKSTTTLEEHLENIHAVYTESRDLDKTEMQKLLICGSCSCRKHNSIASTNRCLRKHKKTRCYVCFESVPLQRFEGHMTHHGKKEKNGMCIVKCSWCDAGVAFLKPFDNKLMAAHCFSQHFSNANVPNIGSYPETEFLRHISKKDTNPTNVEVSHSSSGNSKKNPTMVPSNFKASAPNVLEMLWQASQKNQKKRKVVREIDFDSDNDLFSKIPKSKSDKAGTAAKRIRLVEGEESKNKKPNMSKRTGTPMGPPVTCDQLSTTIPNFTLTSSTNQSIYVDILKLPKVYVKLGYGRSYITEKATSLGLLDKELVAIGNEELERDPPEINPNCSKEVEVLSPRKTIVDIGGNDYRRKNSGKSLKRLFRQHTSRQKKISIFLSSSRRLAKRAVFKSKLTLSVSRSTWRKKCFCAFYNRLGECKKNEEGNCPYIHDKKQLSICPKFVVGKCRNADCKLSHDLKVGRMPLCQFFRKSKCSRENCPYPHIKSTIFKTKPSNCEKIKGKEEMKYLRTVTETPILVSPRKRKFSMMKEKPSKNSETKDNEKQSSDDQEKLEARYYQQSPDPQPVIPIIPRRIFVDEMSPATGTDVTQKLNDESCQITFCNPTLPEANPVSSSNAKACSPSSASCSTCVDDVDDDKQMQTL